VPGLGGHVVAPWFVPRTTGTPPPWRRRFIERVAALATEVAAIDADERALNGILYELYRLSPEERNLVENAPGRRNAASTNG
jgi:hypothetical protein